jgi:hypothetical protein
VTAQVQADVWPQVRAAAVSSGINAEIAATAKYLEALLHFAGADCQRTSDAARTLQDLLIGASAQAARARTRTTQGQRPRQADAFTENRDIVSSSLHSLLSALENTETTESRIGDKIQKEAAERVRAVELQWFGYQTDQSSGDYESDSGGEESGPLNASAVADLASAIHSYLQGSGTRKRPASSSLGARGMDAEQLWSAKPSQIVLVATTCEVADGSELDAWQQDAEIAMAENRSLDTGDKFMELAQACTPLLMCIFFISINFLI